MNHYPCGRGWHLKEDPSYSVSNPFFEACNYFDAMKRRLGVKLRRLERGQSFPNFTLRGQTSERGTIATILLVNSYFPPNTKELFLFWP